ncbi:MAG: hypothetical protein QY325_04030 [Flavobacteriales bacterium]|nr:MAG: hypothetical protein QY325_04030 [Flavobacteriales bacterium]
MDDESDDEFATGLLQAMRTEGPTLWIDDILPDRYKGQEGKAFVSRILYRLRQEGMFEEARGRSIHIQWRIDSERNYQVPFRGYRLSGFGIEASENGVTASIAQRLTRTNLNDKLLESTLEAQEETISLARRSALASEQSASAAMISARSAEESIREMRAANEIARTSKQYAFFAAMFAAFAAFAALVGMRGCS